MLSSRHPAEEAQSLAEVHSSVGTSDVSFWKLPRTIPDDESAFLNHECWIVAYSKPDGKGEVVATLDFYFHFHEANYYQGFNVTADMEVTAAELRADLPGPIKVGQTATLHGYAVDSAGWALMLPEGALLWSAESGSEYADITADGKVTGKAPGTFKARLREVDGQVAPLIVQVPIVAATH